MPTSHAPYRNWKTTFDVKLLRLVRTSCRPLSQTWSVAFSSAWTVVANISSISSSIDMLFMKHVDVQNLTNSLWDIRIFLGLVPKESPCISCSEENLQESILNAMFWTLPVEPEVQWTTYYLCGMSVCGPKERIPQNFIFNLVITVIINGIIWSRMHGLTLTQIGIIMASAAQQSAWKMMRIAREYTVLVYTSQSTEILL